MVEVVTSLEADWSAFASVKQMANHWNRRDWWTGRVGYYWYLTFPHAPQLRSMAERCQTPFRMDANFDLVFLDALHMTLDRVGFEDELAEDAITQVSAAARSLTSAIEPFDITVGPLAGSQGALSFSAAPYEPLNNLRLRLTQATDRVVDTGESSPHFRPHVGIAYCNSPISAEPVIDSVRAMRIEPRVTVPVTSAQLVRLTRAERAYEWTVVHDVQLGSGGAAG